MNFVPSFLLIGRYASRFGKIKSLNSIYIFQLLSKPLQNLSHKIKSIWHTLYLSNEFQLCWASSQNCFDNCHYWHSNTWGSSPLPSYSLDFFSVVPSAVSWLSFVYSQLVCIPPVGVFKHYIYLQFFNVLVMSLLRPVGGLVNELYIHTNIQVIMILTTYSSSM